uniref:Integrase zinc-binding domain-containing protein n=1 Tax=Anopheles minimus TaxID=112268 RepID=A0A182W698_9DIPT
MIHQGLRTAYKADIKASPAELVYGSTLKIPAEFFHSSPQTIPPDTTEFTQQLRKVMDNMRPTQTAWHDKRATFVHSDLQTCTHVFVRNDTVRPALTPPYQGPYEVLRRSEKWFEVLVNGKPTNVSIDRLKPCYTLREPASTAPPMTPSSPSPPSASMSPPTSTTASQSTSHSTTPPVATKDYSIGVTRSQRRVTIPLRYR